MLTLLTQTEGSQGYLWLDNENYAQSPGLPHQGDRVQDPASIVLSKGQVLEAAETDILDQYYKISVIQTTHKLNNCVMWMVFSLH